LLPCWARDRKDDHGRAGQPAPWRSSRLLLDKGIAASLSALEEGDRKADDGRTLDMGRASNGLGTFLRDITLCLSVSRGTSPALVWPQRSELVLGRLTPLGPGSACLPMTADALSARWQHDSDTAELTSGLGVSLEARVEAVFRPVPVGTSGSSLGGQADLLLLPVHGGCRAHVEPPRDRPVPPPADRPLSLRLRVGAAFYVPAGFTATPSEAYTPCVLLVLSIHT